MRDDSFDSYHELKLAHSLLGNKAHECELGDNLSVVAERVSEKQILALVLQRKGSQGGYASNCYCQCDKIERDSHENIVSLLFNHVVVDVVRYGQQKKCKVEKSDNGAFNC